MKKIGSGKGSMTSDLKDVAFGVAGGIVANQASTMLEKSSILGQNSKIAPMAVAGLALAAYLFLPKGSTFKNLAYGALIVSGTEQAEDLTSGIMAGSLTMGFTPQFLPAGGDGSLSANGLAVR